MKDSSTLPPVRLGLVGLSANGGWAAGGHLPAIAALPELELRALCTSSRESSQAASAKFGVPAVSGVDELCARDDVDLIVVTVNAAYHRELVEPALRARKPVLCEWPLGTTIADTEVLSSLAERHGTFARVGLQGRAAPTVRYLRDLIADGYVGRVLSTTIVGSGRAWGPTFKRQQAYTLDKTTGSTMLNIPMGHTIDALSIVLGELCEVTGISANLRPEVYEVETGTLHSKTAEDQVLVSGTLESGAVASIHFRGGTARGTNFFWEILGTDGEIVITGDTGHLQLATLKIEGGRHDESTLAPLPVPPRYERRAALAAVAGTPAYNVAHAYLDVIADLRENGTASPDFAHAMKRKATLDAICQAADSGHRTIVTAETVPTVVTH